MTPTVDRAAQAVRCPACGHVTPRRLLPLFIVSGASGTGKTTLVPLLQRLLSPAWDVFETDILWDSGGDWNMAKCNWLRIADHLTQAGRPVLLCGTMRPDETEACETRPLFSIVCYAALTCEEATLVSRLRARPAWRGCDDEFIAESVNYNRWFVDNARTAFDPPLFVVDTTTASPDEAARRIANWAAIGWPRAVSEAR